MSEESQSYRILVVEDSPTQAVQIAADVESGGHSVEIAGTAEEARAVLLQSTEHPFDVVISDIVMPGEDGFSLCAWINAQPKLHGVSVILLTALRERADVVRGIRAGADSFVTKPYSRDFLLNQEAHGGRIDVESKLGHGALFRVVLPYRSPRS